MVARGVLTLENIASIKSDMKRIIQEVIATCNAAPEPALAAMFENIWTPPKALQA